MIYYIEIRVRGWTNLAHFCAPIAATPCPPSLVVLHLVPSPHQRSGPCQFMSCHTLLLRSIFYCFLALVVPSLSVPVFVVCCLLGHDCCMGLPSHGYSRLSAASVSLHKLQSLSLTIDCLLRRLCNSRRPSSESSPHVQLLDFRPHSLCTARCPDITHDDSAPRDMLKGHLSRSRQTHGCCSFAAA